MTAIQVPTEALDPARRKGLALSLTLVAITVAGGLWLVVWSLTIGGYEIDMLTTARAIVGDGERADILLIQKWRLPRVLAALLAGAALACSGALLQSLVRNPLASPDVIGVNMGATLVAVTFLAAGVPWVAGGALGGAVLAALLLVFLAWKRGIGPERLVLIGIGLHAALYALKTFVLVRFPEEFVQSAVLWTVGTLYNKTWTDVSIAVTALAVLLPAATVLLKVLAILDLGDDLAAGLGLRVRLARLGTLAVAVLLAGIGVALGGPLPFVALAVPFLARLLAGPLGVTTFVLTGALGAVLLLAADVAAQYAFPLTLPVGVVTASLGAPLFFWLLWRHHRREGRS